MHKIGMPVDPLVRKLRTFTHLGGHHAELLRGCLDHTVEFRANEDIIRHGERPDYIHLLIDGWAGRCKDLRDGSRQIMAFLIPGDLCDLHVVLLRQMDHAITALSPCRVGYIRDSVLTALMDDHWDIAKALWLSSLVDDAVVREWLVCVGRRNADDRLAHFLCEFYLRSKAAGLTTENCFDLPLSQEQLADAMGMSIVHMNRSIKKLRASGLVTYVGRHIVLNDLHALMRSADFDPLYLHQQNTATATLGQSQAQKPRRSGEERRG